MSDSRSELKNTLPLGTSSSEEAALDAADRVSYRRIYWGLAGAFAAGAIAITTLLNRDTDQAPIVPDPSNEPFIVTPADTFIPVDPGEFPAVIPASGAPFTVIPPK